VGSSKQEWIEIKWYTSALVYTDDVNMLGGSGNTIQDKREYFISASKETGLEVNADGHFSRPEFRTESQYKD